MRRASELEGIELTQPQSHPQDEANQRAALLIAQALGELQQTPREQSPDVAASLAASQNIATQIERQLAEEKEQHAIVAGQLTTLAGSLDQLVGHLQGLSHLMADLLERLAEPRPETGPSLNTEQMFQIGGEGVSVVITGVGGFQALMEIQKALTSLDQVAHASVERFQEGESRLQLNLLAPVTATSLLEALSSGTGQTMALEASQPELSRLHIKIVPTS